MKYNIAPFTNIYNEYWHLERWNWYNMQYAPNCSLLQCRYIIKYMKGRGYWQEINHNKKIIKIDNL